MIFLPERFTSVFAKVMCHESHWYLRWFFLQRSIYKTHRIYDALKSMLLCLWNVFRHRITLRDKYVIKLKTGVNMMHVKKEHLLLQITPVTRIYDNRMKRFFLSMGPLYIQLLLVKTLSTFKTMLRYFPSLIYLVFIQYQRLSFYF